MGGFAYGGPRAVCGALGHPGGPGHSAVPALHVPPLIPKERPDSLRAQGSLLKSQFIWCLQVVILILVFYNRCRMGE